MENYIERKEKDFFRVVDLEITSLCNRTCVYCPQSKKESENKEGVKHMSENMYKKIISDLAEINFSGSLMIAGFGEPFLNKNVMKFAQIAREKLKNTLIVIYTNGDFLNEDIVSISKRNNVGLYITLHDGKNKIPKNIQRFKREKNVFLRRDMKNSYLTTVGGIVNVKKKELKKRRCVRAQLVLTIRSSGDVVLCCEDFYSTNRYGNVEKESIEDIWKKKKFAQTRKDLLRGKGRVKLCEFCFQD